MEEIVRAPKAAEAPTITVTSVRGVGYGCAPNLFTLSESEMARAQEMTTVEVICADPEFDRLVGARCSSSNHFGEPES